MLQMLAGTHHGTHQDQDAAACRNVCCTLVHGQAASWFMWRLEIACGVALQVSDTLA
jgi:hypothetical protein